MTNRSISESWANDHFGGRIADTHDASEPWWPDPISATGKPNVVFVVLDDVGFASLGCYGSEIETPTMDRLAAGGQQFTNFHASPLCSPTRAALLTGRNHHSVGMSFLSNADSGFPSKRGGITHRAPTVAENLLDVGYNTMAVGKWHVAPMDQTTAAGPFDQWPLGRGFERYYGFLEALTDHYYPELVRDNHRVAPPQTPQDGYHLTEDLVDEAITMVRNQESVAPEKPFFLYLAFGATHCPFQAPPEYVEKYRGRYDAGWDAIREERLARQLELGVVPAGTELAPRNSDVEAWDNLSPEARRVYTRFQEVYAGFLEHTDAQLGRLVTYLESIGKLDDTVLVLISDNGASQEGGDHGVLNTTQYENGHVPGLAENLDRIDEIDGTIARINYPRGWAQAANTPLKRYKQNTHAGGVRTPMIVHAPKLLPGRRIRRDFVHVIDIVPTVLDLVDTTPLKHYRGIDAMPLHGVSIAESLRNGSAIDHPPQYFEMFGHRALWSDGWKAVAFHPRGTDPADDQWELYHLEEDFAECHDLAAQQSDRLTTMIDEWWRLAREYDVLPLDDRGFPQRAARHMRKDSPRNRHRFVYYGGMEHLAGGATPLTVDRSYTITATVDRDDDSCDGTIIAHGSIDSGYSLYIKDNQLVHDYNYYGEHHLVRSSQPVPVGRSTVAVSVDNDRNPVTATLSIDGVTVGSGALPQLFEYFVAWQGIDIGADTLSPVRADPDETDFSFRGVIDRVVVELDSAELVNSEPCD